MREPANNVVLLDALVAGYGRISERLAKTLRSSDQACDALQDTFVKLRCSPDVGTVMRPEAFVFRVALNVARDRRRAETRRLSTREIDELLDLPDDAPCPARQAEAKSELAAFSTAIDELPPRRRAILAASLVEEAPRREIARRFAVSERTIDFELKKALQHARCRLRAHTEA